MITVYEELKRDVYSSRFKPAKGMYGIELETETVDQSDYPEGFFKTVMNDQATEYITKIPLDGWNYHADNSLRNFGAEFVFDVPLDFKESLDHLDYFAKEMKGVPFIKNAPATSTHVHVNMLHLTPLQMANFLSLYVLFESVLVDFSGPTRKSNLFSLPIRAAEQTYKNIIRLIQGFEKGNVNDVMFGSQHVKYAAINIEPLCRFGSFELRSFRGELDIEKVKEWLSIVNQLVEFSKIEGMHPRLLLSSFKEKNDEFFFDVFGRYANSIRQVVPNFMELIERNLFYFAKVCTAVDDWNNLNGFSRKYEEKPKKSSKTMGQPAHIAVMDEMITWESLATATMPHPDWFSSSTSPSPNMEDEID